MKYFYLSLIPPQAPDTPEWVLSITLILALGTMLAALLYSFILELRYTGPYTLLAASSRQKWKWAAILMFFQTIMVPIIGAAAPAISPRPDQWPMIPICWGLWIIVFPIAVAYKRWDLERQLNLYRRTSSSIKAYKPLWSFIIGWQRWLMTDEQKRFWKEGYSKDQLESQNSKM